MMTKLLFLRAHRLGAVTLLLSVVALLAGCGGGGGGGTTLADGGSTPTTPAPPTVALTTLGSTSISGVVASGAPLGGVTLRLIDATGAAVTLLDAAGAETTTAQASGSDGSYRLTLASNQQRMPLLLQAAGFDASATPQVLHSVLLSGSSTPLVSHVTPLTNAVLAQLLGTDPRLVFAKGTAAAETLALLTVARAVTAASDQVKAIVKTNMTDLKLATTLDLFGDANFVANKTGQDLLLEALRVQVVGDMAGAQQLQFGNKFSRAPEVLVDLTAARTALLTASASTATTASVAAALATAIKSTLKASTSANTSLVNIVSVESLTGVLNQLIARGSDAAAFAASPALAGTYVSFNGRSRSDTANLLAGYAVDNTQLGRLQVLGCATDPVPSTGCLRLNVSALVSTAAGTVVGSFADTLSYTKPATGVVSATQGWALAGNGLATSFQVAPTAHLRFSVNTAATAVPVPSSVAQPNPALGVQVQVRGLSYASPPARMVDNAFVQVPSGFSVRLSACDLVELCINTGNVTQLPLSPSGALQDSLVGPGTVTGWTGGQDAVRGAKFAASYLFTSGQPAYLSADVPTAPDTVNFPLPDVLPTAADLAQGVSLSWNTWALAHPNMRVFMARSVVTSSPATLGDAAPALGSTQVMLPANPQADGSSGYQLWLGAQDHLGRRFFTSVTLP